jgi:hypothetical protein
MLRQQNAVYFFDVLARRRKGVLGSFAIVDGNDLDLRQARDRNELDQPTAARAPRNAPPCRLIRTRCASFCRGGRDDIDRNTANLRPMRTG